jgi:serine/threonine protein kinase
VSTGSTDSADTATCSRCGTSYKTGAVHICPLADPSTLAEDKLIGTTIDNRYTVECRLGEGGMGVVYRARHVTLRKPVAIKVLRKAQEESAWKRFIQEAQTASMINHTNVVDLTDFGLIEGHPYLVMEFLEGETLTDAITAGPIAPLRVCRIGAQIARGLQAVHDKGIVHRDLKPDNIFLLEREGKRDVVKIVDFGLAKLDEGQRLTQDGTVVGTAEYISPEQVTGKDTDARSDQYALGCILYEMLTSRLPFDGATTTDVIYKHVYKQPIPPRKVRPQAGIPEALEQVVAQCMAKKPADRFEKMAELEQSLTAIELTLAGTPHVQVVLPTSKAARQRRWLLASVAVLVVLLGLTLVFALRADPRPVPNSAVADLATSSRADLKRPERPDTNLRPNETQPESPDTTHDQNGNRPKQPTDPKPDSTQNKPPLQIKLSISPKKALATVQCDGEAVNCAPTCTIEIPSGGQCEVEAPGFETKTLMSDQAKRKGTWRIALSKSKAKRKQ